MVTSNFWLFSITSEVSFRFLRWVAGLKLIQLEQQKTQLPLITLAKNLRLILSKIFKLERNNLCIQILAAKMP